MSRLFFYKLVSPYKEDITKDCKLTINEIDSNFITLKDADIKSFVYDEKTNKLILTRNSKDEQPLVADLSSLTEGVVHNLDVAYDREKGEIKITWDDKVAIIDGLITKDNISDKMLTLVNTDSTLFGLGTKKYPLGISVVDRTGQYRPCKRYVDKVNGEQLPPIENLKKGDRFVTREYVSNYGYLYDFKGVNAIARDLKDGWRIPTKEDWDNMLNAIELCDCNRNHGNTICNKELGRFAGKLLKSFYHWKGDEEISGDCMCQSESCCCHDEEPFEPIMDGCYHYNKDYEPCFEHHPKPKPINPKGLDSFGMRILPAGYGDGCSFKGYFGERGSYWTKSMIDVTDVYAKRFDYNKAGVVQVAANPHDIMSLRLVKDYDGSNFHEVENINGQIMTCVLMPSLNSENGFAIWTSENVAFSDTKYNPREVDVNECQFFKMFFTYEWNGCAWVKKPLREGESVVLFHGLEDDEYEEYRVVKGELVSVTSKIAVDILEKIEHLINELKEELAQEIEAREEGDEILSGAIEDFKEEVYESLEDLQEQIDELSGSTQDIEDVINEISGKVEENSEAIENEIERAISAETELANEISGVSEALDEEIERAIEVENAISGAVSELSSEIEEETEAREMADEALSGAIDDVAEELANEIQRATEKENEIIERLISGGTYDSVSGVLTLETENLVNNITIQFNGNYGEL